MTEMGQSRSDKYNVQGAVGSQNWVAFACQRYQLGKECRRAAQCACRGCPAQQMDTLMIAAALSVKIRLQRQNGARQEGNVADLHNQAGCQQQGSTSAWADSGRRAHNHAAGMLPTLAAQQMALHGNRGAGLAGAAAAAACAAC